MFLKNITLNTCNNSKVINNSNVNSSPSPSLSDAYTLVVGFGANDFQNIVALSRSKVCELYQSATDTTLAETAVFAAFGSPVLIPELLTKNNVSDALIDQILFPLNNLF